MKVVREGLDSKFAEYIRKKKIKENEEVLFNDDKIEEDMSKSFNLEFTVDGIRSSQKVNANSLQDAKELVKKQYPDKTVVFTSSEESTPNAISEDVEMVFDDDVDFEYEPLKSNEKEKELSAPKAGSDYGLASIINSLIIDEWEAINGYNSAIVNASELGQEDLVKVLTDIQNEENVHVGQLQKCLQTLTPSADKIADGEKEATGQIDSVECPNDISMECELPADMIDDTFGYDR